MLNKDLRIFNKGTNLMKIKTIYQKNYKGKILSIIHILLMTILSFYICHMAFAWPITDSGLKHLIMMKEM